MSEAKKSQNERKSTYFKLLKYQAPMTLKHVILIQVIPLATPQLQSQMSKVPTPGHVYAILSLQGLFV